MSNAYTTSFAIAVENSRISAIISAAPREQAISMLRPAMAPAAEPDRGHPRSDCRLDTEQAVLDDQTPVRGGASYCAA